MAQDTDESWATVVDEPVAAAAVDVIIAATDVAVAVGCVVVIVQVVNIVVGVELLAHGQSLALVTWEKIMWFFEGGIEWLWKKKI